MNIVWFKKDLRVTDNLALYEAYQNTSVINLYILEPELWQQPDISYRHYHFLTQAVKDLQMQLQSLGHELIIKIGNAVEIIQAIHDIHTVDALYSHQEIGNNWTYNRDKQVAKFCSIQSIKWHEYPQNGVIRGLKNRDGWSSKWLKTNSKITDSQKYLTRRSTPHQISTDTWPAAHELGIEHDGYDEKYIATRAEAENLLDSFLTQRGENYSKEMSSPVSAFSACSRLSVYLSFGIISIKEIFFATQNRQSEWRQLDKSKKGKWGSALRSFNARLRWHCHFIQKFEDQSSIEFINMHRGYDGLRPSILNTQQQKLFTAWQQGLTGYPMIDACMRCLKQTGWINFRMRAMLVSFASYNLWIDWRYTAHYLAKMFIDYEPGIHYSQIQMQSGTTGINTIRIYNPTKQGLDQDPDGKFIKQWIPELENMPINKLHTPWEMPLFLNGYPAPIVDFLDSRKAAMSKISAVRKQASSKIEAKQVLAKHGSRKKP